MEVYECVEGLEGRDDTACGLDAALAKNISLLVLEKLQSIDTGFTRRRYNLRAAPLVRVKAKFTVENAVCCRRRLSHTAFLTVNFDSDSYEWD